MLIKLIFKFNEKPKVVMGTKRLYPEISQVQFTKNIFKCLNFPQGRISYRIINKSK